jgi:hypothetical protein
MRLDDDGGGEPEDNVEVVLTKTDADSSPKSHDTDRSLAFNLAREE